MQSLAQWLKRGEKAKRKRSSLKRKSRMPQVSPKRAKEIRIYSAMRKKFLESRPWCGAWYTIMSWMAENDLKTLKKEDTPHNWPRSSQVHHVCKRGKNYLNESTWMAVSAWSHAFIENNKLVARELGLLK